VLRALGLIFLSAFYSLAFQIHGLVGPRGIEPAGQYLQALAANVTGAEVIVVEADLLAVVEASRPVGVTLRMRPAARSCSRSPCRRSPGRPASSCRSVAGTTRNAPTVGSVRTSDPRRWYPCSCT